MIAIACDHAGYELKKGLIKHFISQKTEYKDFGTDSAESCDYPDFAKKVANAVASKECDVGILICGTGIGMSMAANKVKGIRAAVCGDAFSAQNTREHNDANILCLGARVISLSEAVTITGAFLSSKFEGGRHVGRVEKIENN